MNEISKCILPPMKFSAPTIASTVNHLLSERRISIWLRVIPYQLITDIIQSVALEQTELGHIINAEGEKIQKAYALNLANSDMLKINDSVEDMMKANTILEMVLQCKLGLFGNCLCSPKCDFSE